MLIEFILWDQRLSKRLFCENSEGLRYLYKLYFLCLEHCFKTYRDDMLGKGG